MPVSVSKNKIINQMKKVFALMTLAAALLFASNAQAQLGVNIGYAPMTIAVDNNGNVSNTDYPGFFGGVNYNVNLTGDLNLSLGGQVRFITKTETSSFYGLASTKNTTTLINLEVPVLLNYGLNLSRELKVSVFAGAVFGYGLSGQTKFEGNVVGIGGNSTVDWYDANGIVNYKRLNISGAFGAVFTYNQFRLFGGYDLGLTDIDNANTTTKTNGIFVGIGVIL